VTPTTIKLTGDRDLARRLPFFDVSVLLALVGLIAAILIRRPQVLALIVPFVVAPTASLALWRPIDGTVSLRYNQLRVVEGDDVTITVDISSAKGLDRVEIELFPSERLAELDTLRAVTSVRPQSRTSLTFTVRASEWGLARIERVTVRVSDRLGMFGGATDARPEESIIIGLPEDRVAASLDAERFRRIVGSHLSSDRGEGLEIADIRPFQQGDSTRHINWRISNRRQEPWITLRHPDRSTTVVVIVDTHDGHGDDQRISQRRSVAAAMALSRGHLAQHDRVGLLVVGHTLGWLTPKLGRNQLHQIANQLVSVSNAPEASLRMYRPPAVASIPNNAIVVAISPLRDPLMVELIAEIRSHGNPVSVLVPAPAKQRKARIGLQSRASGQSRRFAAVEQLIGVQSLRERGVAIVPWEDDQPVITIIAAAQRLRRSMARGGR